MLDMTANMVRHLDMARAMGIGADASLVVLRHDLDGGYAPVLEVGSGWDLELGDEGQVQTLVVIEQPGTDRASLEQARAFSINGVVYELVGGVRSAAPEQFAAVREWKFPVAPTGEEE